MTNEAMMNIICDKLAGATTRAALERGGARGRALLDLPYVGSRAILKIRSRWVPTIILENCIKPDGPARCGGIVNISITGQTKSLTRFTGHRWVTCARNFPPQCEHRHTRFCMIGSPRVTCDNGKKREHTARDATNRMRSYDTYSSAPRHK